MNNPQQPREYDAVLGGQNQAPESAAVLGGIQGVKLRLSNPNPQMRIAALAQALNYGEAGLDLVIPALDDESWDVQKQAYSLLKSRTEASVTQILIESNAHLKLGASTDYTQLRDLLAAGKWKEADQETRHVMLAVAKRGKKGWLDVNSIDNFPCEDLRTIDQLWVRYSNGRFGLSVQKRIYQSLGGTGEYNREIWNAFADKIGWRKGGNWLPINEITFKSNAPEAHLPFRYDKSKILWTRNTVSSLTSRLANCNI
ncbi:GUN4 domain-containing protein [Cronbergia sp. UHCC 0137]|uniref:GUN4 domain-containing protein n=1 Tax=Cronbergia sp. UHCC 0137 TaxID=3110239 RepID=UPI003A4C7785